VDRALAAKAGPLVSMLTRFQAEWAEESCKWADSILRTVATENTDNKKHLGEWIAHWQARANKALLPVARVALGDGAAAALDRVNGQLAARLAKAGVSA
jgi:phenol hydroxylase P1 protein